MPSIRKSPIPPDFFIWVGEKVVLKRSSLNGIVACLVHESRRYHHMFAVASEERVMSTKSSLTGTCYIFNTGIRWYHHI